MDTTKKSNHLFHDNMEVSEFSGGVKFELVGCSVTGVYCNKILPEINKLYAEAEHYRVNREYQQSAELLQQAYDKTLTLNKPVCSKCVEMFQSSIAETMETMQNEVHDMSVGFFHKKRYEHVFINLSNQIRKMNLFKLGENRMFSTKKSTLVSAEL
jgi:hypothetical protein